MIGTEALEQKVNATCEVFPWYRSLLQHSGPWELEHLPLVTAGILEQFYYSGPPEVDASLSAYSTSGTSSGKRKSIYYSEQDDEHYIGIKTKLFGDWLRGGSIRKALADMGTGHAASTALTIFGRLGLEAQSISFESPVERHIERLESFRPDLLYTMPSILEQIIRASPDPSRYGIKKIILVGEIATPEWRRKMAMLLGIGPEDILDTYGSIEIGTIASYSHELGKYVIADGLYAEGIGTDRLEEGFEPAPDHEQVLVLTSTVRSMFPALRYVTYDVVRDLQTIEVNGELKQIFTCISKRIGPELKHGEKISLYDIEDVIYQFVDDAETRVKVQNNRLSIHIKSGSLDDTAIPLIQQSIEDKIPEIGMMIRNRILHSIEVHAVKDNVSFERGKVKTKKIYY
ncbi:hypothetical protein LJK88_07690 [Paenibacillus sp. P26]|nr:hypothetical protein LJK88_07690 [Paenibacillus sp. P26]